MKKLKRYNRIVIVVVAVTLAVFSAANFALSLSQKNKASHEYRVEVSRLSQYIEINGYDSIDLKACKSVIAVDKLTDSNRECFFDSEYDYLVREINGDFYRFDYITKTDNTTPFVVLNISLFVLAVIVTAVLVYIRAAVIKPFESIKELPREIAKGNLSVPIKETKSRYFGDFLWGMDLLRENVEQHKENELRLLKEKQTLILSVSHDIKTPVGIIELSAKSLEHDLYKDEEKQKEVSKNISAKCEEIKKYVSDLIKASNEEFLKLEVNMGEFYTSQLLESIRSYYKEKLGLLKTEFVVTEYTDMVIKGDLDRSIEILQNIIENAVKYGDGRRIELSAEVEEKFLLVTVTNSGCTLQNSELPHIFESFWRGSNSAKVDGSGLGLSICRSLIRKMGGEIFANIDDDNSFCVTVVFEIV